MLPFNLAGQRRRVPTSACLHPLRHPLQSLSRLVLNGAALAGGRLPPEFAALHSLRSLELRACRLSVLPACVAALPGLTSLDLGVNCLTDLPGERRRGGVPGWVAGGRVQQEEAAGRAVAAPHCACMPSHSKHPGSVAHIGALPTHCPLRRRPLPAPPAPPVAALQRTARPAARLGRRRPLGDARLRREPGVRLWLGGLLRCWSCTWGMLSRHQWPAAGGQGVYRRAGQGESYPPCRRSSHLNLCSTPAPLRPGWCCAHPMSTPCLRRCSACACWC